LNSIGVNSPIELGSVCLIKNTTGIPCPSCGATRSVVEVINLNLGNAFLLNPLGFLITALLLITPSWIIYDVITKNDSLYTFYVSKINISQPFYMKLLFVAAIMINWLWNIIKAI
jgi:hypothetical protein